MTATVEKTWNGAQVKIRGKRVVRKSVFEIGLIVEGQAKALTARDTGRLVGSITTQTKDKGTRPESPALSSDVIDKPQGENIALVGTPVEYAPYVEFGTIRSNAQPFLRPALDLARGNVLTIIQKNGRFEFKEYLQ